MGVPIIAPSQGLMARWHIEYGLVAERTWDMTFRHRRGLRSVLPQHPHSDIPFDPNDDTDEAAVAWWIQWVRSEDAGARGAVANGDGRVHLRENSSADLCTTEHHGGGTNIAGGAGAHLAPSHCLTCSAPQLSSP
jgi:hypothetical protein